MARETDNDGAVQPSSMVDIAATLIKQNEPQADEDTQLEDQHEGDELDDGSDEEDSGADEQSQTEGLEDEDEDGVETDESDEDEGEDDESDEGEDDETEYLDIRDDDLITVMVDGEEQEVSIGELKKAHSGEGAIEKRLQEATELRKRAVAEQVSGLETLAAREQELAQVLDNFDDSVFKEVIPAPDPKLRQSNPEQYLRHDEAYREDQERIAAAKRRIEEVKSEISQKRQERLQKFGQLASEVISREIPELADPKTSKQTFERMATTAQAYGYTPEEINNALDPRMFMLVRDAMRYRDMQDRTKERDPKDLTAQKAKKVRRLRSGNTQAKTRASQADRARKAAMDKAKKTGRVQDVAATLLKPKG